MSKIETLSLTVKNMFTGKIENLTVVKSRSVIPKSAKYIKDVWVDTWEQKQENTNYNIYRTPAGIEYAYRSRI